MARFPAHLLGACLIGLSLASGAAARQDRPPPPGAAESLPAKGGTLAQSPAATPSGKPPPLPPGSDPFLGGAPPPRRAAASGTGFVVAPGRVLTNFHVTEGCAELRLRAGGGAEMAATVAAADPGRDLALLAVRGNPGPPLRFRQGPPVRRGEGVVTYGFPLAGLLSSGPTLTTGEISALSGLRDNQAHFQISAPVQPGNSGGPLLDLSGNVVGVVVSKLNAQRVAQTTGDIPQNVNFAVKAGEAIDFLRRHGVQPLLATSGALRGAAEVGEVAHPSTVFLRCLR
ncbi:S1 family peptidase [Crenalkalicoccus roseus]|uniref:S1 family peptidase n=1 Tax=Crenalkalicoccus roseus TaxID=1485588 RepID=UPI001F0104A2|nr:serine protease [Crenalkalicoccus roseus]